MNSYVWKRLDPDKVNEAWILVELPNRPHTPERTLAMITRQTKGDYRWETIAIPDDEKMKPLSGYENSFAVAKLRSELRFGVDFLTLESLRTVTHRPDNVISRHWEAHTHLSRPEPLKSIHLITTFDDGSHVMEAHVEEINTSTWYWKIYSKDFCVPFNESCGYVQTPVEGQRAAMDALAKLPPDQRLQQQFKMGVND